MKSAIFNSMYNFGDIFRSCIFRNSSEGFGQSVIFVQCKDSGDVKLQSEFS